MGKLTPREKVAITKSFRKASKFLTGKSRPEGLDQNLDKVFSVVEDLKGRTKPPIIGKEAIALWQAKVDFAIANGDSLTLTKLTKFPSNPSSLVDKIVSGGSVAFWDNNGGCSCGGGGGGPAAW